MPKVTKPCGGCGASFESWPCHGQTYCSRTCSQRFGMAGRKVGDTGNTPVGLNCVRCGAAYQRWPSQIAKNNYKYCSRECADIIRHKRRTFDCLACGTTRTVKAGMSNRFCSAACWYGFDKLTPAEIKDRKRQQVYRRRAAKSPLLTERYSRDEIAERDGWRCAICRRKVNKSLTWPHPKSMSIDHIVPISQGGGDVKANVQLAHYGCNAAKRDRALPQGEQLRLIG